MQLLPNASMHLNILHHTKQLLPSLFLVNELQHTATHCNTLQQIATDCNTFDTSDKTNMRRGLGLSGRRRNAQDILCEDILCEYFADTMGAQVDMWRVAMKQGW